LVFEPSLLIQPSSVGDAVRELGSSSRVVAGNTSLYWLARKGKLDAVSKLVDISSLGLGYIKEGNSSELGIEIGAASTFSEILSSHLINKRSEFSALVDAANSSPPQVRNMATIGGSLCSRVAFYDVPVALMALGAELKFVSSRGERMARIEDFFKGSESSVQDLLLAVNLRAHHDGGSSASSFTKLCRRASGYAVVNAAASVTLDQSSRTIQEITLAVGAITKVPDRLGELEEMVRGKEASPDLVEQSCKKAQVSGAVDSVHASAAYKKKVLPIILRDTLWLAIERAREKRTREPKINR
jgi:CO/xanthine dehydrogenase FAD-binding subunit